MNKKDAMSRSENMARVKNKNTKPELYIRRLLWKEGFRYRLHSKKLPGKPDLYLPKYNTAIFVNGCFWHLHDNCKYASFPKNNHEFWKKKLLSNKERDKNIYSKLNESDIKVLVIWGCEVQNMLKDEVYRNRRLSEIKSFILGKNSDVPQTGE
ncbi:very short patch repair endonuclease [Oligella urethralis]|nr:very short patch repair endonuclease [Oligella urethralis]